MMNMEHRREGALIPSRRDLDAKAASHGNTASAAIIGDKKYRGGLVQESQMGIFWGMTVLDFASMYPHIIQLKNISYDTLMCPHDECRGNIIHGTRYWSCTKRNGILAGAIGAIRELRVRYYKRMARETGDVMYETINGTLKVLMNASYGVMGSDYFDMYYLPVADCTTAVGRAIVTDLVDSCRLRGVEVLYGDTDSVMIKPAESGTIQDIIEESRQRHGTDLEIDKEYRYAILTGLKKNYLGVKNDGSIDIKGLTGKKSNTPVFIRHTFDYMKEKLSEVHTPDEMDGAINGITARILDDIERIRERDMLLSEMAYSTKLTKGLDEYGPSPPQHVKAALLLAEKTGIKIPSGATIRYLKTENSQHVMPYELASISQIHAAKYIENLGTVMDQVLPALGTSMERIKTGTSQDSIESFFPR